MRGGIGSLVLVFKLPLFGAVGEKRHKQEEKEIERMREAAHVDSALIGEKVVCDVGRAERLY
jgi:hypothetical protein